MIAVLRILNKHRVLIFRQPNHSSLTSILHLRIRGGKTESQNTAAVRSKSNCLNFHPHSGGLSFQIFQSLTKAKQHALYQMIFFLQVRTVSLWFSTALNILVRWIKRIL